MHIHTLTHMHAHILTHTHVHVQAHARTYTTHTYITNWLYSGRSIPSDSEVATCSLKREATRSLLHFCTGRDVFVSLPTGNGKSMI